MVSGIQPQSPTPATAKEHLINATSQVGQMRVLAADDDSISRLLLGRALSQWGYDATMVADGNQALAILESEAAPSLVILDWMMPGMDGPEICQRIRARDAKLGGYTYVVMLTSRSASTNIVEGLTAGADEYIVKPFQLPELEARLRVGKRIIFLEAKLRAERAEYQRQAQHDTLTGIFNRRAVLEGLERELQRSRREQRCVALVMFDLDLFKSVNDTYGHLVGDEVLVETCQRLSRATRAYDVLGRMGGEEFLAILTCRNLAEASELSERLHLSISARPFATTAGPLAVTTSVGVATSDTEGYVAAALLFAADQALYQAKNNGRNRVVVKSLTPS
jgi:two-component system, cell cycle response regulator